MNDIGAYLLVDVKTGKFYVGSSQNVTKRIERHLRELKAGEHHCSNLQDIWDKNQFLEEYVYPTETREEAYALEQELLNKHDGSDLLLNIGRSVKGGDNLTNNPRREEIIAKMRESIIERYSSMSLQERKIFGSKGEKNGMWGKAHTAEAREKISKANLGNKHRLGLPLSDEHKKLLSEMASQRTGEKNPFFGMNHSDETKKRISETKKLQGLKPTNSRQVLIEGVIYESVTEAGRQLGIAPALLVHRLQSTKEKYSSYQYLLNA